MKDLAKYDMVAMNEEEEEEIQTDMEDSDTLVDEVTEATDKAHKRQLMLIYVVFLAEAYVVAGYVCVYPGSRLMQCAVSWHRHSNRSSRC